MSKIRIHEVLIVEGKYDAVALNSVVDGLIITTDGFSIFSDTEKKELICQLGKARGVVILTDSDAAGFQIRHYVEKIAKGCEIKHAYIPAVEGKEKRKSIASKEGTLGVEGLPKEVLLQALQRAGITDKEEKKGREISFTDLYELGISGTAGSADKRREFLKKVGLPHRLSKKALREVLSILYSYEELVDLLQGKPALFWDFHGTLTLPDVQWFDAAMEAAQEMVPQRPLSHETLTQYFSATCLPWFTMPDGDSRSVASSAKWWAYCEKEFVGMFQNCGFTEEEARKIAPALKHKILQPHRYTLFEDAIPTLRELQKRGYTHYIASNNFPELEEVVTALGLRPYFSKVFVSGLMGFEKPHQEFFELLVEQTGETAEVWMIGDNPKDDIDGGRKAGFNTIAVHREAVEAADYCVAHLAQILDILK